MLDRVYRLVGRGNTDEALDTLFDEIDSWLCEGAFDAVDACLRSVDLRLLDTSTMIGLLTITLAANSHLPGRTALRERIAERLSAHPKRDELLQGL